MPATNIPISATTTDFVAAVNAAAASISGFNRLLNQDLTSAFRVADRADKEFQSGIGRIQRIMAEQASASSRHLSQIGSNFQSAGRSLSTYLTAALLLAGGAAFKAYADIDGVNKGLKVVAGSAQGATKQFGQFFALSQKPGLGLNQTVEAGLQLETLGYKAQTAQKYIAEVGNAIALGGKGKVEFGQVITQFTQMAGKARVMGDDLKPIINASPVIAKAINDMFGTVDSEAISKKLQALGKSPKDFIASLVGELSKLERVEAGPLTALENFGDATKIAGFEFGKAADQAFGLTSKINGLGNVLISGATAFGETSTAVKFTTFSVLGAAAAFGPLALGIGGAIKAFQALSLETSAFRVGLSALTGPIGIAIAAAAAITAIGYAAYQSNKPVIDLVSNTELLSSVNKTVTQSIAAERVELDHLYKTATDESKSKQERAKAIKLLNQLSPEYLGFLNLENINSAKAAEAIFKQGEAILFRGRARAAEEKIAELSKKRFEVEQKPVTDFEKPLATKLNPLTGMPQILSPNDIKQQAQQYKNDALSAIDDNLSTIQRYLDLNTRRASRRGIALDLAVDPTFKFNNGAADSAYDKLKADVDTAEAKIKDFITKNGVKAKIPVDLQVDFRNKSALLKAADDAVKTVKPKVDRDTTASVQSTGDLAIAKRYESELETSIQNLGGKAPQELLDKLASIRSAIEGLQALSSKNQKVDITGIQDIASNATREQLAGIVGNIYQLSKTTPGLFANTGISAFFSSFQQGRPSLDYYQAKVDEIKRTIAELSNQGFKVDSPEIKKLIAQLAELKRALASATGAADAADAATNPGAQGEEDKKWIDKANQRIAAMKASGQEIKRTAQEMATDMKAAHDFLAGKGVEILTAVGEGLSNGSNPLKSILTTIVSFLGDFMIKIGSALLLGGTLLSAAETAFPFLAPLFKLKGPEGIIAGGALVVGGAAVKGFAGKFAKGGVFDSPQFGLFGEYAGAGLNREIATPERLMASVFRTELENYQPRGGSSSPQELHINLGPMQVRGSDLYTVQQRHKVTLSAYGC